MALVVSHSISWYSIRMGLSILVLLLYDIRRTVDQTYLVCDFLLEIVLLGAKFLDFALLLLFLLRCICYKERFCFLECVILG